MEDLIKFEINVPEAYKAELLRLLPQVPTRVIEYDVNDVDATLENVTFTVKIRTNCCDKITALNWKKSFEERSYTSYNVDSTFKENTPRTIFKCVYHCLHNTRPPKKVKTPHYKHVNCPAKLTINVRNPKMKRSNDVHLKQFPCEIFIRYTHNHNIYCADVLRHKRPSEEVENIFKDLFGKGHSPSSALEIYKMELHDLDPQNYYTVVADGSKCPSRRWCYELYYKLFKKEYGDPSGPKMISSLSEKIIKYNQHCGNNCAAFSNDGDDLVVAVCSPMMKNVHKYIKSSGEIMFIDSSGNMDRHNSRIFLMLSPSVAGALPVGLIMTYSESQKTILKALELYKTLLDENSFYKNSFPKVVITDDSTAEREALKTAFPLSTLLLCKFHILQATMRYLWDSKHGVDKHDRIYLYRLFQGLVNYAEEEQFLKNFDFLLDCSIVKKYENVAKYFKNLKNRSKEWAVCYRSGILTRGNETNNYAEAGFRILKDKILHRTKAFSIVQMFSFLTENLHNYYTRRLTDLINNRSESLAKKYLIKIEKIKNFEYTAITDNFYKVTSGENEYFVNTEVELCSCNIGCTGAPCKHQYGVVKTFNLTSQQFIPTADVHMKSVLHKIVNDTEVPSSWYESLKKEDNFPQKTMQSNRTETNTVQSTDTVNTQLNDNSAYECLVNKHFTEQDIETESKQLLQTFQDFNLKLLGNPDVYYSAIKKFNELASELRTESSLVSALHTFGKYTGAGQPLIRKGKNLQGGKTIGVQPTAMSRRKVHLGGRNVAFTGRPPKNQNDHTYNRKRRLTASDIPVPQKKAAPHSLTLCVDHNISLGKNH